MVTTVSSNASKRFHPNVSTCPGHAVVVGNPSPNLIGNLPQAEREAKIVADNKIESQTISSGCQLGAHGAAQ